uniref:Uncharacterized protein n=1 Tax=Anopheles minimus TaxID=112268 RepID=A0A182VS89_9DIPT
MLAHIGRQHSGFGKAREKTRKENTARGKTARPGPAGLRWYARYNQLASQITSQKVRLIRVLAVAPTVSKNGTDTEHPKTQWIVYQCAVDVIRDCDQNPRTKSRKKVHKIVVV